MKNSKQKNVAFYMLITVLILIITILSVLGFYAWAKYTSLINGSASGQVAKWSFKLVDGVTETSDVIDFAVTRTDGYGKVVEGLLAPGTFGEFEIEIDAIGTETILEYTIDIAVTNKPRNLKLYSDSSKTEEIEVTNNKFSLTGYMDLEEIKEIKTVKVYWDWPYESGNDLADTEDAGKNMTMQISVTGTEVLELPPEIISFTIDGTTYYAEEGMTWGEWVDSEYNTYGFSRGNSSITGIFGYKVAYITTNEGIVSSNDVIYEMQYGLKYLGGELT